MPTLPAQTTQAHPQQGNAGSIVLASTSPRRRELLAQLGLHFSAIDPGIEDADLQPGQVSLPQWVASLSWLKAAAGAAKLGYPLGRRSNQHTPGDLLIIAADTLVQSQGQILSKPANADDAATMIRQIRGRSHHVHTGLTLLDPINGARQVCADCAQVDVGDITDEAISNYVASGQWKGKSGGYNLAERISAGWPINVVGDPATVMGLPIARLRTLLPAFIAASARGAGAGGGPWA